MKLCLIVFVCIALTHGRIKSNFFPQCNRREPEIEKCILVGVEALRPRLKDGILEIKVPPLEPFTMDSLHVNKYLTGLNVNATLSNIKGDGAIDFKTEYLKVDLEDTYAGEVKLVVPHLDVTADYNTRGSRMLFFQINGIGKLKASFTGVRVSAKFVASPVVNDGVDYLQLESITTKVSIGKGEIEVNLAESSFTGRVASAFISSSPSVVLNTLSPVIDETAALVVKKYLNDILANVPIQDVLIGY